MTKTKKYRRIQRLADCIQYTGTNLQDCIEATGLCGSLGNENCIILRNSAGVFSGTVRPGDWFVIGEDKVVRIYTNSKFELMYAPEHAGSEFDDILYF